MAGFTSGFLPLIYYLAELKPGNKTGPDAPASGYALGGTQASLPSRAKFWLSFRALGAWDSVEGEQPDVGFKVTKREINRAIVCRDGDTTISELVWSYGENLTVRPGLRV